MSTSVERRQQAAFCARAAIDLFFVDKGYGCMAHADELAGQVAELLDREGRLS